MKMSKISTVVSSALLALAVSGNVFAAENAEGVKEHFALTQKEVKEAQAAAAAGNKEECVKHYKQAKQHYKEITGNAASMRLQKAIDVMQTGKEACQAGDVAKGAEVGVHVSKELDEIAKESLK
ncbi:hypothetical protein JCM19379_11550 [Methyloparacoccus murrellii]